jgi:hypothetical protein
MTQIFFLETVIPIVQKEQRPVCSGRLYFLGGFINSTRDRITEANTVVSISFNSTLLIQQ